MSFLDNFAHAVTGQLPFSLVRVEPVDAEWLTTCTEIKSNYIAELVFERIFLYFTPSNFNICMLTKARFADTLMEYLGNPNAHGPAGTLFEQAAHYSIRKGFTLTMALLVGMCCPRGKRSQAALGTIKRLISALGVAMPELN
ncbi:hypothetical protein BYT27DRAFT_7138756 [Phlegmacium glaucopus]|nr:hypothetical protein BYT27DRAFT_7138756 [Phlegmacium glaucopus]